MLVFSISGISNAINEINILLNGNKITFTENTGFPYLDDNNRTMVPLRATMESAGFVVGYDKDLHTAIVITEYGRIEIPVGTNKVYHNNKLLHNDTKAVVNNGITYLPIRMILEIAGYTVEWASEINTVNAYSFDYERESLTPYNTSNPSTLLKNVMKGNVVYIDGNYYATPEYIKMMSNVQIYYSGDDLNRSIYPQEGRHNLAAFDRDQAKWISGSGVLFDYILVEDKTLDKFNALGSPSKIPGFSYVYAFYDRSNNIVYSVDEMTDEFFNAENATGIFNNIQMKKENGILFFYYPDLRKNNIY